MDEAMDANAHYPEFEDFPGKAILTQYVDWERNRSRQRCYREQLGKGGKQ